MVAALFAQSPGQRAIIRLSQQEQKNLGRATRSRFAGQYHRRFTGQFEAVPANENEVELLNIERGAPLLMLDSISYAENGQPIEYYHALHRGDRSRFEVELIRLKESDMKKVNSAVPSQR